MKNRVMKKLVTMATTLAIMATAMVGIPQSVHAANTRYDGVWLFPLDQNSGYVFTDWAGCTSASYCTICGENVNQTHKSWGDSAHGSSTYGHNGVDIGARKGTPVLATAPGIFYCDTTGKGYDTRGLFAIVEHTLDDKMSYYSYYQHLSETNGSLANGSYVNAGDEIGKVGTTSGPNAKEYGAHLHYGMIIAPKGYFADGKGFSGKLATYERKGWILDADYKYGGRVLVNPRSLVVDGNITLKTGTYVKTPLVKHSGSVEYTFKPENVSIRSEYSYWANVTPTLSISGETYPVGALRLGANFPIRGSVNTDCGMIKSVDAFVVNTDTNRTVDGFEFHHRPNTVVYDLRTTLNNDFIFNNLEPGNYSYIVTAEAVNGSLSSYSILINAPFEVLTRDGRSVNSIRMDEAMNVPVPEVEPTPSVVYEPVQEDQKPEISVEGMNHPDRVHKLGKNFGIRGIVSTDCGVITKVEGTIIGVRNGVIMKSNSYTPNTTSCDLRYTINNDLIFNDLQAGNYTYFVYVETVNGSQKTDKMYSFSFEVR